VELPIELAGRGFSVVEALRAGVAPRVLRSNELVIPTPGTRLAAAIAHDEVERARAVLAVCPEPAALSRVTALRLLGVDVPRRLERDRDVHVTVRSDAVVPQRRGVVAHTHQRDGERYRARSVPTRVVSGLPVVAPARTWLDLAGRLSADELVVLGDAMTRRVAPVTSLEALRAEVRSAPPGTRGIRRAREAVELVRERTDSVPESELRLVIVRAGLPCPEVNGVVLDDVGRFVAMPDLVLRDHRIALEYDGDVHRTDRRTWLRDTVKRERLRDLGWEVITVVAPHLTTPRTVTTRLAKAIARRQTPPRSGSVR
jgi:hypothetical protein